MLFKFKFTKDLKPTMEKVFANEQTNLLKVSNRTVRSRVIGWATKKAFGVKTDITAHFTYKFISDTEADVTIETGIMTLVPGHERTFLKNLKKYETASEGKITVEMISNG
jgi:hypothetical protein